MILDQIVSMRQQFYGSWVPANDIKAFQENFAHLLLHEGHYRS